MPWSIVGWITVIVFLCVCLGLLSSSYSLCWILLVWFLAARLIFGLKRFDRITPALMDLHWLPYPQRITYKLCMIMFKCLRGSAPAYLADYCTSTSLVPGRSALRSAAHGDIVVPSHRTEWGLRSFAVAGPSSWNALPVDLRSSSFGFRYFCKALKNTSIWFSTHTHYSRQSTHFWVCITFCRVRHGDSVTKPDYYYYYYSALELTWWGTTMNSGLKISEAVLYIRFSVSTVERRPSFFHWIYQTFGGSGTLFNEEILWRVGISLVNKVPDLYFYIAYCWNLCWTVRLQITSSFSVSECHFYYGQLVILFRSKWNSLRSNFDRTVNLFHALVGILLGF